jgi:hypothetical protein
MIRELQILDKELSKANTVTVLRRDFTMFGHNIIKEGSDFLRDVDRTATKTRRNDIVLLAVVKS